LGPRDRRHLLASLAHRFLNGHDTPSFPIPRRDGYPLGLPDPPACSVPASYCGRYCCS
jgi:hypothetical protein